MQDTIITIVLLILIFLGLPLLILWLKDRRSKTGLIIQYIFGVFSLLLGLSILGWVCYNIFHPTQEFQGRFKTIRQLVGPIFMIWIGWKWLTDQGPGIEKQKIDFNAPELLAAIERARRTLPEFIERVNKNIKDAYIKFPFITDQGVTENVWAEVNNYDSGIFKVSLVNIPHTQKGPYEKVRDVPELEVVDWQVFLSDGSIKGAFSSIGAIQYLENKGQKLNKTILKQKKQFIDA